MKRRPVLDEGNVVPLDLAWTELKATEFALWVRLCFEHPTTLASSSKPELAKALGYSHRRLNELLRALSNEGYVYLSTRLGTMKSTRVYILKRAEVHPGTGFLTTLKR